MQWCNLPYVIIDLAIVSSMGNRTSTCLLYNNCMIKLIIVLSNFTFKCRLVNETHAIALVQAGSQANQLASAIDRIGSMTNFTKNHASKSFFFSQDSKETCPLIFVSAIKKVHQSNIPFVKTINMYVFTKGIIRKTNCYWHMRFFFDLY